MASSQEAIIQELLFRLASVYIDRLTNSEASTSSLQSASRRRPLRNAEDLVQHLKTSCLVCFPGQGDFQSFKSLVCVSDQLLLSLRCSVPLAHCS